MVIQRCTTLYDPWVMDRCTTLYGPWVMGVCHHCMTHGSWENVAERCEIVIHLRTLSSGGFHPSARRPTIPYSRKDNVEEIPSVSISSSRLAVLMCMRHGVSMVIWDWKSAQILFVCHPWNNPTNEAQPSCRYLKTDVTTLRLSTTIGSWSPLSGWGTTQHVSYYWTRRRM